MNFLCAIDDYNKMFKTIMKMKALRYYRLMSVLGFKFKSNNSYFTISTP